MTLVLTLINMDNENDKLIPQNTAIAKVSTSEELEAIKKIVKNDFQVTRKNIKTLISDGMITLNQVKEYFEMTQDIRWARVYSELLKTVTENNKALLDISASYKNIVIDERANKEEVTTTTTNNNTLIIGSTLDLQKILENTNNNALEQISNLKDEIIVDAIEADANEEDYEYDTE